jgi:hypothetical protein
MSERAVLQYGADGLYNSSDVKKTKGIIIGLFTVGSWVVMLCNWKIQDVELLVQQT